MSVTQENSVLLKKMTTSSENLELPKSQTGSTLTLDTEPVSVVDQSAENLDNSCAGKTKRVLRKIYKVVRSLIGIIVILLFYLVIGAALFMAIESRHENIYKSNIALTRNEMINELLKTSLNLSNRQTTIDQWKARANFLMVEYEYSVMDAFKNNVKTNSTVQVWDFWTSLFFVGTVVTTIGYGNQTPVTDAGRIVCMLYAAIGIPLALLVLAEVGKRFTVGLKFAWAFVRRFYYTGNFRRMQIQFQNKYQLSHESNKDETKSSDSNSDGAEKKSTDGKSEEAETKSTGGKSGDRSRKGSKIIYGYEVDDEFNLPITVAAVILFIYMLLGGMMYTLWEDWGYVDSVYFVFISLSTIGFGDVVPAHPKFFIVSSVYILFGLSLVSMCVNVAIEFFTNTVDRAKQKMGEAKEKMGEAKQKMGEATKKIGEKVNIASKNAKERCAEFKTNIIDETTKAGKNAKDKYSEMKTNIIDETAKIRQITGEKFKKRDHSSSRGSTPVSDIEISTPTNGRKHGEERRKDSRAGNEKDDML